MTCPKSLEMVGKRNGPGGASTPFPTLDITRTMEVQDMPFEHEYDDSHEEFKTCNRCGEDWPIEAFTKCNGSKSGRKGVCNKCRSLANFLRTNPTSEQIEKYKAGYQRRTGESVPQENRWKHLRVKYGLSREDYEILEAGQGGLCAICFTDKPGGRFNVLVVDHCHATGRVRGLLCNNCNVALGALGDSVAAMRRVLEYVNGGAA